MFCSFPNCDCVMESMSGCGTCRNTQNIHFVQLSRKPLRLNLKCMQFSSIKFVSHIFLLRIISEKRSQTRAGVHINSPLYTKINVSRQTGINFLSFSLFCYLTKLAVPRLYSVCDRMTKWTGSCWWNKNWQWGRKYSEKTCPSVILLTTNPTQPTWILNPGDSGGMSVHFHKTYPI
jgi:hypothetical protein